MAKILTRYDLLVRDEKENMNLDLIINTSERNVIYGTVWNDDYDTPKRVAEALIQVFLPGENYESNPFDIKLVGYTLTDNSGDFIVGPFQIGTMVILKVYKFWGNNNYSQAGETSFQIADEDIKVIEVEL